MLTRDFLWRLSSATVELDESDFTPLPAYDRVISTLRGDMVLAHNGGERLTLHPYEIHDFSGRGRYPLLGPLHGLQPLLRRGRAAAASPRISRTARKRLPSTRAKRPCFSAVREASHSTRARKR